MTKQTLAVAIAAALLAAPAAAQEAARPYVEVGVVGSGFLVGPFVEGDGVALAGGGPSVTVGITRRIRIDLRAYVIGPNDAADLGGLYETLIRFPLRGGSGAEPGLSLTAGIAGLFSYHRLHEYRMTRRDGSIVVYPEQRDVRISAPRMGSVGIVHQRIVRGRMSMLLGVDGLVGAGAIVARGTAGVSFGVRRSR